MSISKPKHTGNKDSNKQENNIHYQTYYRSDTRQGGYQQGYNRNPRQDNSNNAKTFKQNSNNYQNNESEEIGDNQ